MTRALILSLFACFGASVAHAQTAPIPLASGVAVEGYLTPESPTFPDWAMPYECYVIETQAGETWEIDVTSVDYAPELFAGEGETCAQVWGQMEGNNFQTDFPRLNFTTRNGGRFLIAISARPFSKGPFNLIATRQAAP